MSFWFWYVLVLHLLWGTYAVFRNTEIEDSPNIFEHLICFIANALFFPITILIAVGRRL